jgi:uncharacterized protein
VILPARDVLLDTGPLVALLDPDDQWHKRVVAQWPTVLARCLSTEAVVTEACHLAGRGGGTAARPLEFLLAAEIPVVPMAAAALRQAASVMRRYADLPMDFADATLVVIGDALGVTTVFTTDRRGFNAYRGARGTPFLMLPR